jgi:DNA-binding NarL/FixJ family response regulator
LTTRTTALCPELIGRGDELEALRRALDEPVGVVLIDGEAGVGKSRLLSEFALIAEGVGRAVTWGRPEEISVPGPYSLILDLVENIAATGPGGAASEAQALLHDLEDPAFARQPRAAPLPRHLAARVRGLVGGGSVVILEDLHAADEASHAVIHHIARTASEDSVLIVASYRSEEIARTPALLRLLATLERERIGTRIPLAPLKADAVAQMISLILGHDPDEALLREIERLGEGVPFFIEELLSATPSTAGLEAAVDSRIPPSIQRAVLTRLDGVSDEAVGLVSAASLVEGAPEPDVLRHMLDLSPRVFGNAAAEAIRAGLLSDQADLLAFRHAIVRAAIASAMPFVEARETHARLAAAIEAIHPDDPSRAAQLARHWREAGESSRASRWALAAGRHALAFGATGDAERLFSEALSGAGNDLEIRTSALEGLGEAQQLEGRIPEALENLQRCAQELRDAGKPIEAASVLGKIALTLSRTYESEEVLRAVDQALSLIPEGSESVERARLLAQKGHFLAYVLRHLDESEPYLRAATDPALKLQDHAVRSVAQDGLAEIADARGDFTQAEHTGSEAIQEAILSGDAEAIAKTHNNAAVRLAGHGRVQAALDSLSAARRLIERSYGQTAVAALDITQAWVRRLMGDPGEALGLVTRPHAAWLRWQGVALSVEIWARLERGETSEAEAVLDRAWSDVGGAQRRAALTADPSSMTRADFDVLLCDVSLHLTDGPSMDSVPLARALVQSTLPLDLFEFESIGLLLVRALAQSGRDREAREALASLRRRLGRPPLPFHAAVEGEIVAMLASFQRESRRAASEFLRAAELYARCSNSSDQARCHRRVAETLLEGDPSSTAQAKESLARARALAIRVGAQVETARAEAGLRALGVRPRAGRRRKTEIRHSALSTREEQISALVAAGATNSEISKRLYLSERTVADHVTNALRKLGLPGRASLAAWAARHGLG